MKTDLNFEMTRSDSRGFASSYVPAVCDVSTRLVVATVQCTSGCARSMRRIALSSDAPDLRWMDTDYVVEEDPYGTRNRRNGCARPGDVVVHSTDAAGAMRRVGELMGTVAKRNGATGCIATAISRLPQNHCSAVPGFLRRHPSARQPWTRTRHGLRRAGALR